MHLQHQGRSKIRLFSERLKDITILTLIDYGRMSDFIHTPIESLVAGELNWKNYIASLTPEDLEKQRRYDRARVNKWYQENREQKLEYCRTWFNKNKERLTERHQCAHCGGSYQLASKSVHNKTKKHQEALKHQEAH